METPTVGITPKQDAIAHLKLQSRVRVRELEQEYLEAGLNQSADHVSAVRALFERAAQYLEKAIPDNYGLPKPVLADVELDKLEASE